MTIPPATIQRYQPGGDIYVTLLSQSGQGVADSVAAAAQTGDTVNVTEALAQAANGSALNDSVASLFVTQLLTDPLAAPLDSLNSGVSKILSSSGVQTILVIGAVGVVALILLKHD